jgi:hypothetical protein
VSWRALGVLERLDRLERGVAAVVDAWRWWFVGAACCLYLAVTCVLARYRLFWNDELFTVYISRLPTVSDIWAILATGVEQLPPTFHLLTRVVMYLLGEHHLTVRLPSILAFGAMSVCLFVIVSRRTSTAYGLIAALLPLVTQAYPYAYEARPYALVLAFSAGSFLCWQSATEGHRRILALAGLAATLAAALASHYYAVLVFVPLAAGELARSLRRRRLDLPIWLAFCVATIPLWVFLPLIQAGRSLATTFWAKPRWLALIGFYQNVLFSAAVPFLAIILVLAIYAIGRSSAPAERKVTPVAPPPLHEVVAAIGYLTIPGIGMLLAKLVTGAFTDRYVLPAVIGLALIVAWGTYHLLDRREVMGVILVLLLGGWFLLIVGIEPAKQLRRAHADYHAIYRFFATRAPGDLPVVIPSPHTFLQLTYYAPPELAPRFVYLADPAAALRYLDTDTPEVGLREFRRWTPLRIEDYRTYVPAHPRFLLYSDHGPWAWLVRALVARNVRFHVIALDGAAQLLLVDASLESAPSETPASRR